jgi:hypothetical protein
MKSRDFIEKIINEPTLFYEIMNGKSCGFSPEVSGPPRVQSRKSKAVPFRGHNQGKSIIFFSKEKQVIFPCVLGILPVGNYRRESYFLTK